MLGVPFEDLSFLTSQADIRSNGSATATEASKANQSVSLATSLKGVTANICYQDIAGIHRQSG